MKTTPRPPSSTKLSAKKAFTWILLSTLLISGLPALGMLYYQHSKALRTRDPKYRIVAIMQSNAEKEPLKTMYLAELLDLSIDHPSNLYRFNADAAQKKLLESPLIKDAQIKKIKPGMLYIDYTTRKPIAFLADYTNTVIDAEGYPFPFKPFFTPKKLPKIYLGLSQQSDISPLTGGEWGGILKGERAELALCLLRHMEEEYRLDNVKIQCIDVSKAYAPSYGRRQIVITLEERIEKEREGHLTLSLHYTIIRLSTENYISGIANYFTLRTHMQQMNGDQHETQSIARESTTIVDLRIPQLAFVSK